VNKIVTDFRSIDDVHISLCELRFYIEGLRTLSISASCSDDRTLDLSVSEFSALLLVATEKIEGIQKNVDRIFEQRKSTKGICDA